MILDYENSFSDDQDVTVTAVGSAILDMGTDGADVPSPNEKGGKAKLVIQATETFTAAGAATLTVTLQTSDSKSGVAGSEVLSGAEDIATTLAIPVASLVAGYKIELPFPTNKLKKYVGVNYTVATGPMTAGSVFAGLVFDDQTNG